MSTATPDLILSDAQRGWMVLAALVVYCHGEGYARYASRVGQFLPFIGRSRSSGSAS